MAVNILLRKSRFSSRSDREREKLQAQISTYAIRHNSDMELAARAAELRESKDRLAGCEPITVSDSLERLIDSYFDVVDSVLARYEA